MGVHARVRQMGWVGGRARNMVVDMACGGACADAQQAFTVMVKDNHFTIVGYVICAMNEI
jgi:hypothetical protein